MRSRATTHGGRRVKTFPLFSESQAIVEKKGH
ncbi:hypothetical protein F383_37893 [Gossypium arboreum]|uniref:Uncharacterized protein n=1 Tax=Gossypium arboreum TaxID=29729 RepID=A0A0B0MDU6_GOSAR|nr:hypothetical protein F383_37893 [Gossypium arboreum]